MRTKKVKPYQLLRNCTKDGKWQVVYLEKAECMHASFSKVSQPISKEIQCYTVTHSHVGTISEDVEGNCILGNEKMINYSLQKLETINTKFGSEERPVTLMPISKKECEEVGKDLNEVVEEYING